MEGVFKHVMELAFPPLEVREELEQKWERDELIAQMSELRAHIRSAESCFASVTDEDLIEASIYELASLKARYNYLMKLARRDIPSGTVSRCTSSLRSAQKIKTWGIFDAKLGTSRSHSGTADPTDHLSDTCQRA